MPLTDSELSFPNGENNSSLKKCSVDERENEQTIQTTSFSRDEIGSRDWRVLDLEHRWKVAVSMMRGFDEFEERFFELLIRDTFSFFLPTARNDELPKDPVPIILQMYTFCLLSNSKTHDGKQELEYASVLTKALYEQVIGGWIEINGEILDDRLAVDTDDCDDEEGEEIHLVDMSNPDPFQLKAMGLE